MVMMIAMTPSLNASSRFFSMRCSSSGECESASSQLSREIL
jgi:hypothetical protein